MKIKKIYEDNDISKYEILQSNTAIINSLRRVIISEIPTISIQYIKFIENSSHFFSEFILDVFNFLQFFVSFGHFLRSPSFMGLSKSAEYDIYC